MAEAPRRIEIPLTVEHDGETVEIGRLCYVREDVAERDNAKLRELVRDMAECMNNSQPRCKKCKFRELNCQWFKFDDRMRELGIEAGE